MKFVYSWFGGSSMQAPHESIAVQIANFTKQASAVTEAAAKYADRVDTYWHAAHNNDPAGLAKFDTARYAKTAHEHATSIGVFVTEALENSRWGRWRDMSKAMGSAWDCAAVAVRAGFSTGNEVIVATHDNAMTTGYADLAKAYAACATTAATIAEAISKFAAAGRICSDIDHRTGATNDCQKTDWFGAELASQNARNAQVSATQCASKVGSDAEHFRWLEMSASTVDLERQVRETISQTIEAASLLGRLAWTDDVFVTFKGFDLDCRDVWLIIEEENSGGEKNQIKFNADGGDVVLLFPLNSVVSSIKLLSHFYKKDDGPTFRLDAKAAFGTARYGGRLGASAPALFPNWITFVPNWAGDRVSYTFVPDI